MIFKKAFVLFSSVFIFNCLHAEAHLVTHTMALDTIGINSFLDIKTYDDEEIREQVIRGRDLIINDSIDEGMKLIGESINYLLNTHEFSRKMDYPTFELVTIIRDFGTMELSDNEKELRDMIIHGFISKETEGLEKKIKKAIKKDKESGLFARLQVLMTYFALQGRVPERDIAELQTQLPDHSPVYLLRAQILADDERYAESIPYWTKAIATWPTNAYAYFKRAACHDEMGETDAAIEDYEHAVTLFSNYSEAYNNRGDIYYYEGDYEASIADYSRAVEISPENSYYWKDRANAYMMVDQYEKAILDFQKAIGINDQYDYAIKRIGDCYYYSGEYEKAIPYYNKALAIDPRYKGALLRKGLSYGAIQQSEKAIETYQQILEIDASYATAYGNIGWENYVLGNYNECISFSKKAIALDDGAAYAMFNIALSTLRMGQIEEAKELYSQYKNYCQERNIEIPNGALQDLRDVREQNEYVEEVNYILESIL